MQFVGGGVLVAVSGGGANCDWCRHWADIDSRYLGSEIDASVITFGNCSV